MITLSKVEVEIAAVAGARAMRLGDVLSLGQGALIELDAPHPGAVRLVVGDHAVASGRLDSRAGGTLCVVVAPEQ